MFSTILVPLDGSELARRALPYAATLARQLHARLILLHAYAAKPRRSDSDADPELDVVMELSEQASDLRQQGVQATTWLSYDESGAAIVEIVSDLRVDLLVMSTHGRGGLSQMVFGSVAEYVVRHSTTPVILVTDKSHARWPSDGTFSIVVPLDGSPFAEQALVPAQALAAAMHGEIILLRTPEPPIAHQPAEQPHRTADQQRAIEEAGRYLEATAGPLRAAGLTASTGVETGTPAAAIARVANTVYPSLVVMATHGRGTLSRLLLETVASETLRKLHVPVLLVRPTRPTDGADGATAPATRQQS